MKTKSLLIKGLMMLLLILAGAGMAMAQGPYPRTGDQTICITGVPEPYGVIPTPGSTYTWTVDGVSSGSPNWTLVSDGSNLATILWMDQGTYRVRVLEFITATQCPGQEVFINVTVNPRPTATISGATAVCQNAAQPVITFTGANGTAPYTFTYNINGGADQTVATTTGNSVTITVSTTDAGTFTYNLLSVTDSNTPSCSQPQTGSAVITVNPLPTATISGTAAVCQNAAEPVITFTGANGTSPFIFTYTINGGTPQAITSTGNTANINVPTTTAATTTYALVSVQDASGTACSQPQTGSAVITVDPLPTVTVNTSTVCDGTPATITATPGTAGTYSYAWTVPAGVTNPGNVATFTSTVAGTYSVVITNTTTTCVSASASGTVTVDPLPTVTVNSSTVCDGTPATITATPGTAGTYSYAWTVPAGVTNPGNVATFTSTVAGTYSVVITNTTTTCVSASASGTVTVDPLPTVTVNSSTVCDGTPATITATPGTAGTYSYAWTVPAGVTNPGNVATFTSTVAGTYSVVITNTTTTCVSASASGTVTVDPLPTVTVNSSTVCDGTPATITATPGTAGTYSYAWTVPAGVTNPGNVATFTSTVAGTYSVVITNTTTTCVSASASGTITVNPLPTPVITGPNPVCQSINGTTETYSTPNVAGNTYTWTVTGGIISSGEGTNQITVTWTTSGAGSVTVTETVGSNGCSATVTNNITVQPAPVTSPIYHN